MRTLKYEIKDFQKPCRRKLRLAIQYLNQRQSLTLPEVLEFCGANKVTACIFKIEPFSKNVPDMEVSTLIDVIGENGKSKNLQFVA